MSQAIVTSLEEPWNRCIQIQFANMSLHVPFNESEGIAFAQNDGSMPTPVALTSASLSSSRSRAPTNSVLVRDDHSMPSRRVNSPVTDMQEQLPIPRDIHAHFCSFYRLHFACDAGATKSSCFRIEHGDIHKVALETSISLVQFSIFPTSADVLAINDMLWRVARTGVYDTSDDVLFKLKKKVIKCIGLSTQLYAFLSSISLEELHTVTLDFLLLLHSQLTSDSDEHALHNFLDQLHPPMLAQVLERAAVSEEAEPAPGRRADILEQAVQLCFLTPWEHPVFAAYESETEKGETKEGKALVELHSAWVELGTFLQHTGVSVRGVTDALQRAVNSRRGQSLLKRASMVASLNRSTSCLFSLLPKDLIDLHVVPWVLRRDIESIPPCTRSSQTEWLSMAEVDAATRMVDDMRAAGLRDDTIHLLDWSIVSEPVRSRVLASHGDETYDLDR